MWLSKEYLKFVEILEQDPELVKSLYLQWIQFVIDKYKISRSTCIKYLWPQNKYKTVKFDIEKAVKMRNDWITDKVIAKELGTYTTTLWKKLWKRSLWRSQEAIEKIQDKSYSKLYTNERKLEQRSWNDVDKVPKPYWNDKTAVRSWENPHPIILTKIK